MVFPTIPAIRLDRIFNIIDNHNYVEESKIDLRDYQQDAVDNIDKLFTDDDLATISKLMGHSQLSTTLHYLRDVNKDDDISSAFQNLGLSANL